MIKIFKNFTKVECGISFIAIAFIVVQVWLELTLPDYMSQITMLVQTPNSEMGDIFSAGFKMLACAGGSLLASIAVAICASKVAANFSFNIRRKIFSRVQSFSSEEMSKFSTASLITRSTNDVTHLQTLIVMGLQALIKAPITAVWAICKISNKNFQWTLATVVAVLVLLLVVSVCLYLATPKFKILQKLTDDLNRITRENLNGLSVIRAYNAQQYQEEKFEIANTNVTKANTFANRTMAFMMPGMQLVSSGLTLAIYWIGAVMIQNADMMSKITLFSDMVVFSSYAMQVIMSFMMLIIIFILWPRSSVAAKRILEVLDTEPKIKDGTKENGLQGKQGEIEFKNVSFYYPDAKECILKDISFTAKKGETVAFIGATASGKSTLINLIPRFYDTSKGEVLVDGVNVKEYKQSALREKIAYISQKAMLFTGTVKSNVTYGSNTKEVSDGDCIEAVKVAQADEFVENMENDYNAYIAQGGSNLSGGQKQRLSIARAIYRNPEIFIFDDSFSALDYKTDRLLRDALKEKCSKATKLIVAQRIGTILDADKIIVLENGQIKGMGKHDELMKNCEVYRQIAYSQLSKEELS